MRIDPDILHRAMAALEVQSEYVRGLEALDAPAIAEEYERQWAERVGCEPPDANCDGKSGESGGDDRIRTDE